MLMHPDSLVAKRAFFASKHLFVTPHEDGQLFPSGDHVVQSEECLGLKQWTQEVRCVSAFMHHVLHSRCCFQVNTTKLACQSTV